MSIPKPILQAQYLLIDSRKLLNPEKTAFFAIQGTHQNGKDFIPELYEKGVRKFVGAGLGSLKKQYTDAFFWEVADPIVALQELAAAHRSQFNFPILGITGSNGKTIVKEWLFQLLESRLRVVKSPKSYNSQLGVPLSVWEMQEGHELGIFEAGISKVGEMEKLEKVLQPNIGLFTNIGPAHQEGFDSLEKKIEEKLQLFIHSKALVYCCDHELIREKVLAQGIPSFTWGAQAQADLQIVEQSSTTHQTTIKLLKKASNATEVLTLPFTDRASVENALHCIALCYYLGYSLKSWQQGLLQLRNLPMRLEMKEGQNQCLLIDDTYNNDLAGLGVALNFLAQQEAKLPRIAILSDFLETGTSEQKYREALHLLEVQQVEKLFTVGKAWKAYLANNSRQSISFSCFDNTKELRSFLRTQPLSKRVILIKGARTFALENIVGDLQRQNHETRLEINLDAIAHNFRFYKSLLPPQTKMMVMVKAFAYGSGGYEVARLLQYHRADYLAVAYTDEGIQLRERGISLPIMVLNPTEEAFPLMAKYSLEPEIYSLNIFHAFIGFYEELEAAPAIHLKLNTGMNRLGFDWKDIPKLQRLLKENPKLKVASAFTHLAAADELAHEKFTLWQLEEYRKMIGAVEEVYTQPFLKHALNSPGITRFANESFDMVRLGIGLYGVDPNNLYQNSLKVVGSLKTYISQIRTIKANETVGYGRMGKVYRDSRIGVMAIGYADGYDRGLGNGVGKVWVNGQLAPTIGNICMDMSMVDLTGVEAKEGDEVQVFGGQVPIQQLAQAIDTIPYEILTNVGHRVKRVFFVE